MEKPLLRRVFVIFVVLSHRVVGRVIPTLNSEGSDLVSVRFSNEGTGESNSSTAGDPMKGYRSNDDLFQAMKDFSVRCQNISRLYRYHGNVNWPPNICPLENEISSVKHIIGKSVKGVDLWVIEISDKPGLFEPEPAFKYVGNMHGDEPSGRELTLLLAEWLCSNYHKDDMAELIVRNVHLHLLPTMNPDGFELRDRNNANNVDLNRDFPDQFVSDNDEESARQPETKAVMEWIRTYQFTASASLHEGALVVSYGWDGTKTGRTNYEGGPDDGAFKYLAALYAMHNPSMREQGEFEGGVTNGAAWYPLYGGMQDWNYIHSNCFEITIEMNEEKWPHMSQIPTLWEQHRKSMLNLVASLVNSGIHGRVTSAENGKPLPAVIAVEGNTHVINASFQYGDFHRILPPGETYYVTAQYPGYESMMKAVLLPKDEPASVMFQLQRGPSIESAVKELPEVNIRKTGNSEGETVTLEGREKHSASDCIDCLVESESGSWIFNHAVVVVVLAVLVFLLSRFRRHLKWQSVHPLHRRI